MALAICCNACNTAHIGDLYPASTNSSVCLGFFRMRLLVAFPTLLLFQKVSCFFRKFLGRVVKVEQGGGEDPLILAQRERNIL